MRHLLEIDDLTPDEVHAVLALADAAPAARPLAGRGAALLFEKPSTRTRHSMEIAVVQLGGHPVTVRGDEVGLDVRESVEDVTRTLACYHELIAARVFEHEKLERMAALDVVPIINMLSDDGHPLQALADLRTLQQAHGALEGCTIGWVGDANNVLRSLALAAGMVGARVRAELLGYRFDDAALDRIAATGQPLDVVDEPADAVAGADAVYTDVWASMGQEDEARDRRDVFAGYQVDEQLLAGLDPKGIVLHCLPAHRGEEISAAAVDGPRSRVWAQAENRMHVVRGLLSWLLEQAT